MKKSKLENLDSLIEEACYNDEPFIIQIASLKDLFEMSFMGAQAVAGHVNNKEKDKVRKEIKTEMMLRKYIQDKAKKIFEQKRRKERHRDDDDDACGAIGGAPLFGGGQGNAQQCRRNRRGARGVQKRRDHQKKRERFRFDGDEF